MFVVGHSEGAIHATRLAQQDNETESSFLELWRKNRLAARGGGMGWRGGGKVGDR